MGSKKVVSTATANKLRRNSNSSGRIGCHRNSGGASVSDKLEALKSLVSWGESEEGMKAEQLFQETADYIVLLKTRALVLQKLIDFYGSQQQQPENPNPVQTKSASVYFQKEKNESRGPSF